MRGTKLFGFVPRTQKSNGSDAYHAYKIIMKIAPRFFVWNGDHGLLMLIFRTSATDASESRRINGAV